MTRASGRCSPCENARDTDGAPATGGRVRTIHRHTPDPRAGRRRGTGQYLFNGAHVSVCSLGISHRERAARSSPRSCEFGSSWIQPGSHTRRRPVLLNQPLERCLRSNLFRRVYPFDIFQREDGSAKRTPRRRSFRSARTSGGCTVYLDGFVVHAADYFSEAIWRTPSEIPVPRAVALEIFIAECEMYAKSMDTLGLIA